MVRRVLLCALTLGGLALAQPAVIRDSVRFVAEQELVRTLLGRVRGAIVARVETEERRLAELRSRPVLRDPSAFLAGHGERLQTARDRLTRADIWNINAGESPALEYSTYKTTADDYYSPDARRSSDHDPVVVGVRRR